MTFKNNRPFWDFPQPPADPPEPTFSAKHEQIVDLLDTLRHDAFELYNNMYKANGSERARLQQECAKNKDAALKAWEKLLMLQLDFWGDEYDKSNIVSHFDCLHQ